jgi:hypothetical protein
MSVAALSARSVRGFNTSCFLAQIHADRDAQEQDDMAHPDPKRQGSEKDQRRHVGNTSEASDVGIQDKSQGKSGTAAPERKPDDPSRAPESGDKPEADPQT